MKEKEAYRIGEEFYSLFNLNIVFGCFTEDPSNANYEALCDMMRQYRRCMREAKEKASGRNAPH